MALIGAILASIYLFISLVSLANINVSSEMISDFLDSYINTVNTNIESEEFDTSSETFKEFKQQILTTLKITSVVAIAIAGLATLFAWLGWGKSSRGLLIASGVILILCLNLISIVGGILCLVAASQIKKENALAAETII